jgi:hypothetical protein
MGSSVGRASIQQVLQDPLIDCVNDGLMEGKATRLAQRTFQAGLLHFRNLIVLG